MKNVKALIIAAILLIFALPSMAQQANTLYYMDRVFQSQTVNVSAIPVHKVQVGGLIVPVFGQVPPAMYFNYGNNSFNYNHIIHFGKEEYKDSLIIDLPLLMKKVHKTTAIRNEFRLDLLNLSFKSKNNSAVTVSLAERILFGTTLPKDLFEFAIHGNKPYMDEGKAHNLSKLSFDACAFHELGIGFATEFAEKFSVGGRLKLMFGIADISTNVGSLSLTTNPENYFVTADADFQIRKSTSLFEYDQMGDSIVTDMDISRALGSFGNFGVGLDLGFTYNITDKISASISLTDLGFINWMQNAQIASAKGEYTFEGVELTFNKDSIGKLRYGLDTTKYKHIADSLIDMFDMKVANKSYMTWLPSNIFLGATYQLNDKIGFGVLYRGEIYRKSYNQSLTLSANSNINHWLSLHGSWSLINNTIMNIGLGISARAAFMTWYVVTDDVIGLIFPQKAKTINWRMGCNLTFGHPKKVLKTVSRL